MANLTTIKHLNHNGDSFGETVGTNVNFSLQLNKPEILNYDIDLSYWLARREFVEPDVTDFLFLYKDLPLFGGMHTEVDIDNVDENVLKVSAGGWLHYFENRFWSPTKPDGSENDPYSVTDYDVIIVAQQLLDAVSTDDSPQPFQLHHNNANSGQVIDYDVEVGDTTAIFSKVEELSQMEPGFDYEITWDRWFKTYTPKRGRVRSYSFEQGVNCGPLSYRNPGIGGNYFYGTASEFGTALTAVRPNPASFVTKRRKDITKDFGELGDGSQGLLDTLADGEAVRQLSPIIQLNLTWMGDSHISNIFESVSLGDTVLVKGDTGYERVDRWMRIVGIEGNPTNEGDERLTITFDDDTLSL